MHTDQAIGLTIDTAARDLHWSISTESHIEPGHSSDREKITYRDYLANERTAGCQDRSIRRLRRAQTAGDRRCQSPERIFLNSLP